MSRFAVIDTETTWSDKVMSIGLAIADSDSFDLLDQRYYILTPYKNHGGMFSHTLYIPGIRPDLECSRERAMDDLQSFLNDHAVGNIFAYNAAFDHRHLPELSHFSWYDIMRIAAYRQHNSRIPVCADCYGTGRLKSGYGVESIYRMLSGSGGYCEMHNALTDAIDELHIMRLLGHGLHVYEEGRIG